MTAGDAAGRFGPDLFRLDGRVALVTGAGGFFGRMIAIGLARAGAAVFLTDKDAPNLEITADLAGKLSNAADERAEDPGAVAGGAGAQ